MYLFYRTNIYTLKSILKSGYIKSYSILKKERFNTYKLDRLSDGIYDESNYIYFDFKIMGNIILYFNSKLLFNRKFFIANYYTNLLNILEKIKIKDGNILYSRKYKKYYKKYDTILNNLFTYSMNANNGVAFQAFQQ